MSLTPVARRCVFYAGGYTPKSASETYAMVARELAKRFAPTWGVVVEQSEVVQAENGMLGIKRIVTRGEHWQVETAFCFCNWEDIVHSDFARPLWKRLLLYLLTLADYIFSGTLFRIFRAGWRYGIYFIYPFLLLLTILTVSCGVYGAIDSLGFAGSGPVAAIGFLAVAYGLIRWPGDQLFLGHLMDLRTFMRQYLRESRPDARERVGINARLVVDRTAKGGFDEILIVGHSTGSVLALDIAAKAIELDADLAHRGARISVLTVGSAVLTVGLHPAAEAFRARVGRIAATPGVEWIEYQSLTDAINFYKSDPAKAMGLQPLHRGPFPIITQVRFRDMLEPVFYKRMKRNLFRVHYQFVMGNSRRYHYDFFMICCGPLTLPERALGRILGPAGDEPIFREEPTK
ncbi:MAG: lipase [Gammaproteobacteria bacterium]|nr:lipase [Gammaproteobacteria bacterium]MBU1653840.1 lipase [Gammaproteobacteria bacterium]MBU1961639.1 lipase [Gammaproteobacteria bacterium]